MPALSTLTPSPRVGQAVARPNSSRRGVVVGYNLRGAPLVEWDRPGGDVLAEDPHTLVCL